MLIVGLWIPRIRGTSKLMSAPHVICRIVLIGFVLWLLSQDLAASDAYVTYLRILLAVNLIGLAFDSYATLCWLRGDRQTL